MTNRKTLEAMAGALWVHPSELTGQPWTPQDVVSAKAYAGLTGIEIALELYELGVHPEVPVRAWPQIQADIDRLVRLHHHVVDYVATAGLAGSLADSTEVTTERDSDQACRGLDYPPPLGAALREHRRQPGLALPARAMHQPDRQAQPGIITPVR